LIGSTSKRAYGTSHYPTAKPSTISAHTRNYLCENERKINKFVDDFTGMAQAIEGHDVHDDKTL